MKSVSPEVYLISRPSVDWEGVGRYLDSVGADGSWEYRMQNERRGRDGENLIEFAGRLCYRSWQPGLNPNVSRVREDSTSYLQNMLAQSHGSVMEHANYTFVFHNVSRVFCYDSETEVLTSEGWVAWPDVTGDELFVQVDPVTQEMSYTRANERFRRHYSGPMYRLASEQVDLMVTPHHSLYVQRHDTQAARRGEQPWEKIAAEDVMGKRVHHLKTVLWRGVEPEKVRVPDTERRYVRSDTGTAVVRSYEGWSIPTDTWAEWLGWYLSEGNLNDGHRIGITQNEGADLERILVLSDGLGRPSAGIVRSGGDANGRRVQMSDACLHDWLRDTTGGKSWEKRVPSYVFSWSPRLIRLLLDAMVKGDGSSRKDGNHRVIYTTSRQMADDIQRLAIQAGWSANIREDDRVGQEGGMPGVVSRRVCYIVSLVETRIRPLVNHNRQGKEKHDQLVHYEGEVHCVSVPTGLLVVRRNGKPVVCGNTHELVRHRVGTAISQESLRYVRLDELRVWLPEALSKMPEHGPNSESDFTDRGGTPRSKVHDDFLEGFVSIVESLEEWQTAAAEHYGLDDEGVPFAYKKAVTSALRRLAPIGLATSIVWTANIRTIRHVLEMRTAEGAEEEIRLVFGWVGEKMRQECPDLFADYTVTESGAWVPEWRKV